MIVTGLLSIRHAVWQDTPGSLYLNRRIIHVQNTENYTNGTGKVYNPNPTTTAETTYGGYYVDNNDANNYYLEQELQSKTLRDLTYQNGKYNLKGPYCWVYDCEPPYTNIPKLSSPYGFNYTRDQEEFEAVNVYYHVDLAGRRVHSLLGYYPSGLNYLIADPHGGEVGEVDNSGYVPGSNYLWFGDGGVDGAEDAEIIWHEYAHAIQQHVGDGNMTYSGETKAVQEGSSDYWAVSYSRAISDYNWALFADWDMNNEFFNEYDRRRLDRHDMVYPDDYLFEDDPRIKSEGHYNSQIWSSALMEIWEDIDKEPTDRIFLEMHENWGNHPGLRDAAAVFMSAARDLYGDLYLCDIVHRFKDHGLTDLNYTNVNLSNPITSDLDISGCIVNLTNVTVQNNAKLTIVALKQLNITGSFVASIGSELDISGY